ncbi:MAG: hypothetical protein FWC26_13325 [Fibromonadales bacterium]|nr:hypothetical protein [Fibromonadales bacterium]
MKQIFPLFALAALLLLAQEATASDVWDGTTKDITWYTDSSSVSTFRISTAAELAGLAKLVNGGNNFNGKIIELESNISLNTATSWKNWDSTLTGGLNAWIPIGDTTTRSFRGTFDGKGYTISGMYISKITDPIQGLFGSLGTNGKIRNLGVDSFYVCGKNYIGGLLGIIYGMNTSIDSVWANGNVSGVTSSISTGGLIGRIDGENASINYAWASGFVRGNLENGPTTGGSHVGGLIGDINVQNVSIRNVWVNSDVIGGSRVGGLVGYASGSNFTITNSYALGSVDGTSNGSSDWVGGLVGSGSGNNFKIINSYSAVELNGYTKGGLVGRLTSDNFITTINSYYDKEKILTDKSAGTSNNHGIGLTKNEIQSHEFTNHMNLYAEIETKINESEHIELEIKKWKYNYSDYPTLIPDTAALTFKTSSIPNYFDFGDGSDTNPYLINTKLQLLNFAMFVNTKQTKFINQYVALDTNIFLNDINSWAKWKDNTTGLNLWTSIGSQGHTFEGTFDGRGHTINGMYINKYSDGLGLFGSFSGTIKNLGVNAFYIKCNANSGGLIGVSSGPIVISNAYTNGKIDATGSAIGGFIGYASSNVSINDSYALGIINGYASLGGFVGGLQNNTLKITNSYSAIVLKEDVTKGGLIGINYDNSSNIIIENSYYDLEKAINDGTIALSNSHGTDITSIEMIDSASFENWDFVYPWGINGPINEGMPYLQWQSPIYNADVETIKDTMYTGDTIKPAPLVSIEDTNLTPPTHFDYDYTHYANINVFDSNAVIIVGKNGSFGKKRVYFNITPDSTKKPTFPTDDTLITTSDTLTPTLTLASVPLPSLPNGYSYEWSDSVTKISNKGIQTFDAIYRDSNYVKSVEGKITVNVAMGQGKGSIIINGWTYNDNPNAPSIKSDTHDNTTDYTYYYSGTANDNITKYDSSTVAPTEAGTYEVSVTLNANKNYSEFTTNTKVTIERATTNECSASMADFVAGTTPPSPIYESPFHTDAEITFLYRSDDSPINSYPESQALPANAGNYIIRAIFGQVANYEKCYTQDSTFTIHQDNKIDIAWTPKCNGDTLLTSIYNGTAPNITAKAGDYALKVTEIQTNAGNHTAIAQLDTAQIENEGKSIMGVSLLNTVCPYTILPKPLKVKWTSEIEFVYNKNVQNPNATANDNGSEIPLFINGKQGYVGEHFLQAEILNNYPLKNNYTLTDDTLTYTITKKPLDAVISNASSITLDTSYTANIASIEAYLRQLISYNGFATDTAGQSDDASTLNGTLGMSITKMSSPTDTTGNHIYEKYLVQINTSGISADNYSIQIGNNYTIPVANAVIVPVTWNGGTAFEYNGEIQGPIATAGELTLQTLGRQSNANDGYAATAYLDNPKIILTNSTMPYTISKKPVTVTWSKEAKYVYNKTTQGPTATIDDDNPAINWRIVGIYSGAGKYTEANHLAPYVEIISSNAGNYELRNNSVDYEILKKDLTPKFETTLPEFTYKNDTLRVPSEVYQDSAALRQILDSIVAYEGFADSSGIKDDKSVLKGKAKIALKYDAGKGVSHTPNYALAKRVETTQKATATIITDDVSADNYAPLTRSITVVEMEDDEGGPATFCKREEKCIALNEEICWFLGGTVAQTCDETPILNSQLSTLNSQLPKYYTLKGTLLGTQKPAAPGIYIEVSTVRAENFQPQQRARKIVVR